MIINGGPRSQGAFFAQHLTNGETNEQVTLREMRNLAATDIHDAFREMKAVASGTLCKNYFYHSNINPTQDEALSPEQWTTAVDTLERHLRLDGHARFVVEHWKKGRVHRHVVWSRTNVATMRVAVTTDDYAKHQAAARELEEAFGLRAVESVLGPSRSDSRPMRRPESWETFRGQTSGIDPYAMKQALTQLYHECADGAVFAERLTALRLTLVKGDHAEYCLRDSAGHLHSLARRLHRVTASELQAFLRNVSVPSPAESMES